MTRLVASELLKLRTTRVPWVLALLALGLVVIGTAAIVAASDELDLVSDPDQTDLLRGGAGGAGFVPLLLGILIVAGEFRHETITQTFLVTPVRERVVAAKLLGSAIAALALALASLVLAYAIAIPGLSIRDIDFVLPAGEVAEIAGTVTLAFVLAGAIGVGVGAIVPNQVGALVVVIAWSFVIEPLLILLLPEVGRFTPGGASGALNQEAGIDDLLTPVQGGLLLAAYAIALSAAGAVLLRQRDVT